MQGLKEEWEQHELSEPASHAVPSDKSSEEQGPHSAIHTVTCHHLQRGHGPAYSCLHSAPSCASQEGSPGTCEADAAEINPSGVSIHHSGRTQQQESLLSWEHVQHTDLQSCQRTPLLYGCHARGRKHFCLTTKHQESEIPFLSWKLGSLWPLEHCSKMRDRQSTTHN